MLERITTIYEVLARFDDAGALQGCHRVDRSRIVDTATGEVLSETLSPAEPLTATEAAALIAPAAP